MKISFLSLFFTLFYLGQLSASVTPDFSGLWSTETVEGRYRVKIHMNLSRNPATFKHSGTGSFLFFLGSSSTPSVECYAIYNEMPGSTPRSIRLNTTKDITPSDPSCVVDGETILSLSWFEVLSKAVSYRWFTGEGADYYEFSTTLNSGP